MPKNRIELLPILRRLRELETQHCQITATEAQLDLLRKRMAEFDAKVDIDEHKQASQLRTCCVCYDDVPEKEGRQCPEVTYANDDDHFVCASCLDRYVSEEIDNNKDSVYCIEAACGARYSDVSLARTLPEGTFARLVSARVTLRTRKAVGEAKERYVLC